MHRNGQITQIKSSSTSQNGMIIRKTTVVLEWGQNQMIQTYAT